jgi:hypothetical protein
VPYFPASACVTASRSRSPRGCLARTGISRPASCILPSGSARKARYRADIFKWIAPLMLGQAAVFAAIVGWGR